MCEKQESEAINSASGARSDRPIFTAIAEWVFYGSGALTFVCALVNLFTGFEIIDGIDWFTLGATCVTCVGAGMAMTIYKEQGKVSERDQNKLTEILENLSNRVSDEGPIISKLDNLQGLIGPARDRVDDAISPIEDAEWGSNGDLSGDSQSEGAWFDSLEGISKAEEIRKVEGDGVYYLPGATPAEIISAFAAGLDKNREGATWGGRRLLGGYRKFNQSGNLKGVPWVLAFREDDGEVLYYSVSRQGRGGNPTVKSLDVPPVDMK